MSRFEKSPRRRTLSTAAMGAVLLFAFGTVFYRLTDGGWSVGKPLRMAIMITAIVTVCTAVAGADKSSKRAAKGMAKTAYDRRSSERIILIGLLIFCALMLAVGVFLAIRDLSTGRGIGTIAWVAAVLLSGAIVLLAKGFQTRRAASTSTTRPDQSV